MEQFREDYRAQCAGALAACSPDLGHFLPPPIMLTPAQRWDFALQVVASGYLQFSGLTQFSGGFLKEMDSALRGNELWAALSPEAYGVLFAGKESEQLVKRFIKGELVVKNFQPEGQLLLASALRYYNWEPGVCYLRSEGGQNDPAAASTFSTTFPQVYTYDKPAKKLLTGVELTLPKSCFVVAQTLQKQDKPIEAVVKLELAIFRAERLLKDPRGARTLHVVVFVNEPRPDKLWEVYEILSKLPAKSAAKRLLQSRQLRLVLTPHTPLEERVVAKVRRQVPRARHMSDYKLRELIDARLAESKTRGWSASPKKKRRLEKSQPPPPATILEEPESSPEKLSTSVLVSGTAATVAVAGSSSSSSAVRGNSSIKRVASAKKPNPSPKQSPMRGFMKILGDKVGSVNVANYSPVLRR